MNAFRQSSMAAQVQDPELERLIGDYAKAFAARRLNYPDADELHDVFRRVRLRIVSERMMPRKWSFSTDDSESIRKFLIVATRD